MIILLYFVYIFLSPTVSWTETTLYSSLWPEHLAWTLVSKLLLSDRWGIVVRWLSEQVNGTQFDSWFLHLLWNWEQVIWLLCTQHPTPLKFPHSFCKIYDALFLTIYTVCVYCRKFRKHRWTGRRKYKSSVIPPPMNNHCWQFWCISCQSRFSVCFLLFALFCLIQSESHCTYLFFSPAYWYA